MRERKELTRTQTVEALRAAKPEFAVPPELEERVKAAVEAAPRRTVSRINWGMALAMAAAVVLVIAALIVGPRQWRGISAVPGLARGQGLVAVVAAQHVVTDSSGRPIKQGDRLPAGATVRTGAKSRATLFTRQGSEFTLNAGTEMALSRTTAVTTVNRGEVYCRNRQGEIKRIETPAGTVMLLGTTVNLNVRGPNEVAVTVVSGKVRLSNAHGEALVSAGRRSVAVASRPPETGKPVKTATVTAWYDGRDRVVSAFGEIAYAVGRYTRFLLNEVWVMNADGTNKHRLKTYVGFVSSPASIQWIPGERRIVLERWGGSGFVSTPTEQRQGRQSRFCIPGGGPSVPGEPAGARKFLILDTATGQETPVELPTGFSPRRLLPSPSGSDAALAAVYRPAGASFVDREAGTWLYDLHTGDIKKLLDTIVAGGMAWAPDGRRLAISIYGKTNSEYTSLVVVDTVTGELRNLGVTGTGPAFSPDGTKLACAYSWYADPGGDRYDPKLRGSICVTDLRDGGRPSMVSPPSGTATAAWPQWSPNGKSIGYVTFEHSKKVKAADSPVGFRTPITFCVANADGSGVRKVYEFWGRPYAWSWTPSGDAIYMRTAEGTLLIAADGSGLRADLGGTAEDSVLTPEQRVQTDAAAAAVTDAFTKWGLGDSLARRGRAEESTAAYRSAADAFAALMWKYPLTDLSPDEVLAFANDASELASLPREEILSQVCRNRMDPLAHLLLWYGSEHGKFPPDLATLQDWSISKGEDAECCRTMFRCPEGDGTGQLIPYVYNPKATTGKLELGDVIISCPKHPERGIKWDRHLFLTLGEVAGGGHDLLRNFGEVP